jgi:hypothetical protein
MVALWDIPDEILNIIMSKERDVRTLTSIHFLHNHMTCVVYTKVEFYDIVQGDMSITGYCHRLKSLSDTLHVVVTSQALVMSLLPQSTLCQHNHHRHQVEHSLLAFTHICSLLTLLQI